MFSIPPAGKTAILFTITALAILGAVSFFMNERSKSTVIPEVEGRSPPTPRAESAPQPRATPPAETKASKEIVPPTVHVTVPAITIVIPTEGDPNKKREILERLQRLQESQESLHNSNP